MKTIAPTVVIGAVLLLTLSAAKSTAESIEIGTRLQLLVDDHLIERFGGGAQFRQHRPEPREIVLTFDKPWEGNTSTVLTFFRDGDVFRMFYRGQNYSAVGGKTTHPTCLCYAESTDGIHWRRPELGLVEFEGSKQNNIIGHTLLQLFKDTNPNAASEARYKAFEVATPGKSWHRSLFVQQSPDGIHWKRMRSEPVMTQGTTLAAFDTVNVAFWDAMRGEYRAYIRDYQDKKRGIKTATSQDFMNWSEPQWLEYPDTTQEELYTNMVRPYAGNPELFIGFPTRYVDKRGSITEPLFMTSRDGRGFRLWEEAIIRPGRNSDRWGNRCNYIWYGMIETEADLPGKPKELSMLSGEHYYMDGGVKVRRFTYRPDGFVSVNAPWKGGEIVTKPMVFSGDQLVINCATAAAGSARIELQDQHGKPFAGFGLEDCTEIFGDELALTVKWKDQPGVAELAGKPVRMRVVLKDADLYSFHFRSGSPAR